LQQFVGAVLDHAPRRQVGQFVIIGRTEQLILDRLQFGDVGGGRQQQAATADLHRPMGREQDLAAQAIGDGFFGNGGTARTQQFETGLTAMLHFRRTHRGLRGHSELCGRGIVDQQEAAVFILHRDAAG
jgi:hypothetical protein